ncbi:MAG: M20/M25/M40 family metallo-hydrolase, partial [Oscillospiraceae bacterium]
EHFLKCDKAPVFSFTPDTDFPVCNGEKGIMSLDLIFEKGQGNLVFIDGGIASNMVADRCTMVLSNIKLDLLASKLTGDDFTLVQNEMNVKITAKGVSSHAAHPDNSVNAISKLAKILLENDFVTGNHKIILEHLVTILSDYNGVSLNIAFSDEPSGKLTHIGGMIRQIDDRINLNLNIRYPVTIKCKQIIDGLEKSKQIYNYIIDSLHDSPPSYTPADSSVIKILGETFNSVTQKQMQPYIMGGGTYARYLPNTIAFGPHFPDRKSLFVDPGRGSCHQPDECQNIDDLIMAIKIYVLSILEIDSLDFSNSN